MDYRSPEAAEYRKLYRTARWLRIRNRQLDRAPFCEWCEKRGTTSAAVVCHHAEPHKGDRTKFFGGPFVSLCKPCHDKTAAEIERTGWSTEIGLDGWPTHEMHPANAKQ